MSADPAASDAHAHPDRRFTETAGRRALLRRCGLALRLLIGIASIGFFIWYVAGQDYSRVERLLTWRAVPALLSSFGLYIAAHLIIVVNWAVLLGEEGRRVGWLRAATVTMISQLAKYIPGNVAQHVGRVAYGIKAGISSARLAGAMFFEVVITVFMALVLVTFFAAANPETVGRAYDRLALVLEIGATVPIVLGVLVGVAIAVPVLHRLPTSMAFAGKAFPGKREIITSAMLMATGLVVIGMSFEVLVDIGGPLDGTPTFTFAVVYICAWLAGFLFPGPPAGLGVRELVIVALLSPFFDGGVAAALTIAHRFLTAIGDLSAFAVGAIMNRALRPMTAYGEPSSGVAGP